MKIVLYSDDINLLSYWEKSLKDEYSIVYDLDELKNIIDNLNKNGNFVLILHRTPDLNTAKRLLKIGVKGYGNAFMREHFLISAIHTIKDGMIWLYPQFTTELIAQLPATKSSQLQHKKLLSKLSKRESEVALLLKDGTTYKTIANKLNITPRTIKAHAQNIYKKLNVKDRLALALLLR